MFKLILQYTFTGLFVGQFVMFVMLVTKFAYEDIPFFLPLPIATYFAKDLIIKWYGRMDNHVPLSLAVAKDVRFWRVSRAPSIQPLHLPRRCLEGIVAHIRARIMRGVSHLPIYTGSW